MYDKDYQYANSRLAGTFVKRGEEFVFVREIGETGQAWLLVYDDQGDPRDELSTLEELNVSSPKLGYVNSRFGCFFLSRRPLREDWRQGIRDNNCFIMAEPGRIGPKGLEKILPYAKRPYPSFAEVVKNLPKAAKGAAAWAREWAINTDGVIFHAMFRQVGKLVDGKPVLDKQYKYLEECLKESL